MPFAPILVCPLHYSELVASSIKFIPSAHSLATVSERIRGINYSPNTVVGLKVITNIYFPYFIIHFRHPSS